MHMGFLHTPKKKNAEKTILFPCASSSVPILLWRNTEVLDVEEQVSQKFTLKTFPEQENERPVSQTSEVLTMSLCSLHRAPDITTIKKSNTNTVPQALCLK